MKKLPIGIQTFSSLIEENYLYVDKREQVFRLIESGKDFFLFLPRRFGKSPLLSTLELRDKVYVIEIKLDGPEKAIEQIKKKDYAESFAGSGKKVILLRIRYINKEIKYMREDYR